MYRILPAPSGKDAKRPNFGEPETACLVARCLEACSISTNFLSLSRPRYLSKPEMLMIEF